MTISEHKQQTKPSPSPSPSSPPACLKSCFSSRFHHDRIAADDEEARTPRSPYKWLKSTAAHEIPEIRYRCRGLISRLGRNGGRRWHNSSDFSYDPSSYALNFEDEESFAFRNFSARLPVSPKAAAPADGVAGGGSGAAVRREIVGFS